MSPFRLRPQSLHFRQFTSLSSLRQADAIPYTQTCPSPTCTCLPTPALPSDLPIDHITPLLNTMASYSEQVVICTGQNDWTSRIEDEQSDSGDLVRGLKGVIGRGGEGFDPFTNVLVTASSFRNNGKSGTSSAMLFPSFRRIEAIPHTPSAHSAFATAFLKSPSLHPAHAGLSEAQKKALTRDESAWTDSLPKVQTVENITVLICGHGGRDQRCGIFGPVLKEAFDNEFSRQNIRADVGLISHIGGHKYAGNVIIYIPPTFFSPKPENKGSLRGSGIWYGRVGPEHVEGIVEETVLKGRVIADLFRGGISKDGGMLGRKLEEQLKREKGEDGALKLKPKAR